MHGAKCLAALAGVAWRLPLCTCVRPVRASPGRFRFLALTSAVSECAVGEGAERALAQMSSEPFATSAPLEPKLYFANERTFLHWRVPPSPPLSLALLSCVIFAISCCASSVRQVARVPDARFSWHGSHPRAAPRLPKLLLESAHRAASGPHLGR